MRIGWLGDYGGYLPTEPGVIDTCRQALRHFQSIGCTVEAAQPAFDMARLWNAWVVLRSFLVAGGLGGFYADPKLRAQLKPEAIWGIERGRQLSGADVYTASADRSVLQLGHAHEQACGYTQRHSPLLG